MPAKVLLAARANVTAGLANEVDDVNQYAEQSRPDELGARRTQPVDALAVYTAN